MNRVEEFCNAVNRYIVDDVLLYSDKKLEDIQFLWSNIRCKIISVDKPLTVASFLEALKEPVKLEDKPYKLLGSIYQHFINAGCTCICLKGHHSSYRSAPNYIVSQRSWDKVLIVDIPIVL